MSKNRDLGDVLDDDNNQKYLAAVVGVENQIRLWNTKTWALERIIVTGHNEPITQVEFSNDGRLLASSSLDGFVKLWDVKKGEFIKEIEFKAPVGDVSFSPNSDEIAAILNPGSSQNSILCVCRLDDFKIREVKMNFSTHLFSTDFQIVQYSPTGEFIAVLDKNEIRIVESETMEEDHLAICWSMHVDRNTILQSPNDYFYYNFDFSKDGTKLLCSTLHGIVCYSTQKAQTNPRKISSIDCEFCKFSSDGRHIVHASRNLKHGGGYPVGLIDTETYELWKPLSKIQGYAHTKINTSPSENLVGIRKNQDLTIVDMNGVAIQVLGEFEADVSVFTFSP